MDQGFRDWLSASRSVPDMIIFMTKNAKYSVYVKVENFKQLLSWSPTHAGSLNMMQRQKKFFLLVDSSFEVHKIIFCSYHRIFLSMCQNMFVKITRKHTVFEFATFFWNLEKNYFWKKNPKNIFFFQTSCLRDRDAMKKKFGFSRTSFSLCRMLKVKHFRFADFMDIGDNAKSKSWY